MQITDKGKGISWKDKTMHLRARQKISYRTTLKTKTASSSDVQVGQEYKISWKIFSKMYTKNNNQAKNINW